MTEPVIHTESLTIRYGKLVAVDSVNLDVPPGCVLALMGRNGAGKTSLIRALLGLTPISSGSATVFGLSSAAEHVEIRRRVGYVPESHHQYRWMTVAEIVRFTSAFYPTWDQELCDACVERFGLDRGKKIKELSRGMVAKVALTLALAHKPELLVLDEPTGGLDAVIRREFLESVVDVAADEGRTVLISSHLLGDVERVADRVALLHEGKLRLVEDAQTLKARVREAELTFPGEPPDDVQIDGCLSARREGHEWRVVLDDWGDDTVPRLRAQFADATVSSRDLSLEEIFVALVGGE